MNEDTVLRPAPDVRYRIVDGEAVVVRQKSAEVLVMSEVAARILALADGTRPVGAWVEALASEFEVERETLERDVLRFAAELVDEGILTPEDTA
ncbi:MAG TPA: PqqD family protein [Thermoanaerobaculia bacterium]